MIILSPKLILLIEDDQNLGNSIALILKRTNYLVASTGSVSEAIEILQSNHYQLVIADINMPATSEILLPKIKELYPELPIVILTDQYLPAPIDTRPSRVYYVDKPIDPRKLLDIVTMIISPKDI